MHNGTRADEKIPFLDLITPHQELREELCAVFTDALSKAAFIGGAAVEGFERDFAAFCDTAHSVGVANGTDALRFALMAANLEQDSIAVTVPNTFIATTEAISQAGLRVDFVDIDERTYNMDPEKLRHYLEVDCSVDPASGKLINRRQMRPVSAIVPVHLYGQPADMDLILDLAAQCGLVVIEDACQAHGAEYFSRKENRWRKAGSMGLAAAFSFYPGKNLGACGEGGAVTTNDPEVAKKIKMLRDHGQSQKYYHEIEGYNGRLDAIQAGILRIKLQKLAEWNDQRRSAARRYLDLLSNAGLYWLATDEPEYSRAVYHLFVIRVHDRERLMSYLAVKNIGTGIHYPVPLHQQKPYESLGYRAGDFPISEATAPEIVSLPMFPQLREDQQLRVLEAIREFLAADKDSAETPDYAAAGVV
jgi:dTDP-4-amino-4,6-dideoxygalactose transaminase